MHSNYSQSTAPNHGYILFLCTGNYYRSRFAEAYFNHCAKTAEIGIHAISRGLDIAQAADMGPISPHTKRALADLGIPLSLTHPTPVSATDEDFRNARAIIALQESEHRPMIQRAFPQWESTVQWWNVADVQDIPPQQAIPMIIRNVDALIATFAAC